MAATYTRISSLRLSADGLWRYARHFTSHVRSIAFRVDKMSEAKVRGHVHLVEETKTFGQKGFRKRLVVLEQDNGRFQNFIPIEFIQDSCDQVNDLKVGDEIEVTYRLGGRKWQRDPASEVKYFLSCEASSFRVLTGAAGTGADEFGGDPNNALAEAAYEDDEDVPF